MEKEDNGTAEAVRSSPGDRVENPFLESQRKRGGSVSCD